jgi:hypothetical protein
MSPADYLQGIREHSRSLGHAHLVAHNPRGKTKILSAPHKAQRHKENIHTPNAFMST